MPIRWRLTLWFSLILLVILLLAGAVLYTLLENYLTNGVDENLRVYSAKVHGTLDLNDKTLNFDVIHSKLPSINEFAFPGVYIQIMDRSGKVVVKSDNLGDQELPVDPVLIQAGFSGQEDLGTVAAGENANVRIMVSPVYLKDQTLLLEVAQSLKYLEATMDQLRWALLAAILLALGLTGLSGGMLVRRTLHPVEQITRTARLIEAGSDLKRRVGYRGPEDEIGRLARTFDHMIQRLDLVFESQKSFVADASHELRSPLTVIRGNLDLLKRDMSDEDRRECLRAIDAETRRMGKIVDDLLLLAEVETDKAVREEPVSLKKVLLEEFNRALSQAGGRKIVIGQLEDLTIKGDGYHLQRMLANLVDNAIKYTPDGGAVTLSVTRNDSWACLDVADTGIGIGEEHLPYIFDRFYRVDKAHSRAKGGCGLGLAIVKGIAEQHGGRVTVASTPGKGSDFTVWFPL